MNEPDPATASRPDANPPDGHGEPENDGLAIGGSTTALDGPSGTGSGSLSDGDPPDEDEDDEEEEEEDEDGEEDPPELQAAGQQNCPPTPYEECFDMRMFELEPTDIREPTATGTERELAQERLDEAGAVEGIATEGKEEDEPESVASTEEPRNEAEASVPSEEPAPVPSEGSCFGVRRKCEPPANGCAGPGEAVCTEEPNPIGTKKKVRPNRLSPDHGPGSGVRSRKKQYWTPESPTNLHRPLERSWPPKPSSGHRPPDDFSFAIIDMDEPDGAIGGPFGAVRPDVDGDASTPLRRMRLDRNGTDPEPDGAGPGTVAKMPLRKTAKAVPGDVPAEPSATSVRPHRPLARTPSNGREPRGRERPLPVAFTPPEPPGSPPGSPVGSGQARTVPDLVCPPTPTHHARRQHRMAAASASCQDGFGPPELRPGRPGEEPTDGGRVSPEHDGTVRHVPSMRLPSIPERSRTVLAEPDDPLPPAWEARMDSHGRIFYIDHATRTTSWQRPGPAGSSSVRAHDPHRQQLDRRYQSIRRTIYEHMRHENGRASTSAAGPATSGPGRARPPGATSPYHPALLMLCRSDFYSMLHTHGEAIQIYNRNAALKHMVSRVRRDPGCFGRYQHNRDLVALVNCFAQTAHDLPTGWETKLDQGGKQFFIDHGNRRTSFMDPRLPTEGPRGRHHRPPSAGSLLLAGPFPDDRPIPPPRPPGTIPRLAHVTSPEIPVAYNDKVVAFLRQPNILEILRERHGAAACSRNLREKINAIRVEGTSALDRFSHDLELTILLSLFEDEVMTYVPPRERTPPEQSPPCIGGAVKTGGRHVQRAPAPMRRDFEAKLRGFYRKLESKGYGQGPHKLRLEVRRAHLVEDAFERIMAASRRDLQRCRLNIVWDTEDGLDYGGPSREFFYLLSRQLFSPYRKMFEYSANDIYTVQIAPERPTDREDILEWYRFSGRVLGLALVHQYLLDAFFTRPFYKALLRLPVSLSDLESLDSSFHQSLLWIRDNNMDNCGELGLNFTVTEERADGSSIDIELKPNGRNITVSERNKRDYLERIIKWRLERGVLEQTEWLVRGFNEVVDHRLVAVFDASELELVISGTVEIDVQDWRSNTEYRGGYHDSHHVIVWFWAVIDRLSNEQRLRLLQFVTGTSSIPHDGFAGLRGSNGLRRFCIEKWGKSNALPRSHTCFNRLDLPPYPTPDILYEKLVLAVEETNTFGIE